MNLPINSLDNVSQCITAHYCKESAGNLLGGGSSKILATAIIEIYETTDATAQTQRRRKADSQRDDARG